MKPVHEHDCDKCVYLGRLERAVQVFPSEIPSHEAFDTVFSINAKREIDLYFCAKQPTGATVIARYSSEGPDYLSGLLVAEGHDDLREAKILAQARGLLP